MTEINWSNQESNVQKRIQEAVKDAQTKAKSCAVRASNHLRNAAMNVLRGSRSGKRYRKPYSNSYYTASAQGEPPAVRTGMLRMSWGLKAEGDGKDNYTAGIYTDVPYAEKLDKGTPGGKIKPRPYKDKIIEEAKPKVISVFEELGTK